MTEDNTQALTLDKWISCMNLARRWKIKVFQLIDCLQLGLRPYTPVGTPAACHVRYHRHRFLTDELSACRQQLRSLVNDSEVQGQRKMLKKREVDILNELQAIEEVDSGLSSFRYLMSPISTADAEEFLGELRTYVFRFEDVKAFEKRFRKELGLKARAPKKRPSRLRTYP